MSEGAPQAPKAVKETEAKNAPQPRRPPRPPPPFMTHLSYNMARSSAIMLVMLGFAGLLAERNNTTYLFSAGFGVYCIVLGAAVSVIELASLFTKPVEKDYQNIAGELVRRVKGGNAGWPAWSLKILNLFQVPNYLGRGLTYIFLGALAFPTVPTSIAGLFLMIAGAGYLMATYAYKEKPRQV
mmetsp:Transcript_21729/g.56423  ORF Transcript_21729/g.56423 Transcript_21729/m.56423 type:complete len:183 (-) Transcript_21729:684-1232(-)